jgi:single-strand DNA-binding protein
MARVLTPYLYLLQEVHMNKVMLIGKLGRDPEFRYTPSGTAIAKLTLITNRRKPNGEEQPPTWHRITVWSKLAEICAQYLTKDRQVMIEGRIEYGSYDKDGVKHFTTDIIAETMLMLGSRTDPEAGRPPRPVEVQEGEIPF